MGSASLAILRDMLVPTGAPDLVAWLHAASVRRCAADDFASAWARRPASQLAHFGPKKQLFGPISASLRAAAADTPPCAATAPMVSWPAEVVTSATSRGRLRPSGGCEPGDHVRTNREETTGDPRRSLHAIGRARALSGATPCDSGGPRQYIRKRRRESIVAIVAALLLVVSMKVGVVSSVRWRVVVGVLRRSRD